MYLAGFGNHHQTEAILGALPKDQNSPQHCPFNLYTEQLSGTAFTRPRALNLHSWLYRLLPSVVQGDFKPYQKIRPIQYQQHQAPNPYRWYPFEKPNISQNFIEGLFFIAGNAVANAYLYQCTQSMKNCYFSNYDGELLFVPYLGELLLYTEFGKLSIKPGKIAVIPRGVRFKVELSHPLACGYLCENLAMPFVLPQLGPLGSNSLANPRHFLYPQASFEDIEKKLSLISKFQQSFWKAETNHSPLNVVAWHGNYAPYSYDLSLFNTINTVSFDHPDPSIFTVLTAESNTIGVANLDFVIFPPRWLMAEHSFRPPYFHRNIMNEFMGLVSGEYDAKEQGFKPGGLSIHNCMTAHGPDQATYQKAIQEILKPRRYRNSLAFMFESRLPWLISAEALDHPSRQLDYSNCWQTLKRVKMVSE